MSKLYLSCKRKLSEFMKILKYLDKNNTGKIDRNEFIKALKDNNNMIIKNNDYNENMNQISEKKLVEQNEIVDLLQLIIINMKNNTDLDKANKINITKNDNNNKGIINIYDLYYNSIIKIITENCKSKLPLYKGIIKNYLIDKNINSMNAFLEPLLLNNDIIINKGLNRYIKTQSFKEFLIRNKVIGENETFLIPFSEENLIDINELIQDIDQAKPLT
jgi:Ca2+-binding EF-hand superfamily protein